MHFLFRWFNRLTGRRFRYEICLKKIDENGVLIGETFKAVALTDYRDINNNVAIKHAADIDVDDSVAAVIIVPLCYLGWW